MEDKDKKRDPMPPPDATPEEIGEFWDTHSLADYWDETHEVEFQVNLKSRENLVPSEHEAADQRDTLLAEQGWQELKKLIQKMGNDGHGFEKLVAKLLGLLLETHFEVAKSGYQPRGDAVNEDGTIVLQTKHYSDATGLNRKEIVGDIGEAYSDPEIPNLQAYVLAASRTMSPLLLNRLDKVGGETGLDIVTLELTDNLSNLGVLCVTFWKDIHHFFDFSNTCQYQEFSDWAKEERDKPKTIEKIERLKSKLKHGQQSRSRIQKDTEEYLIKHFGGDSDHNLRFNYSIDLSQATERKFLESRVTKWWYAEGGPVCYLEGKEGMGKSWLAAKCVNSICSDKHVVTFWLDSSRWSSCKSLDDLLQTCLETMPGYQDEKKIIKLKRKIRNIWWPPTLIVLDGVNEGEAIEAAKRILDEYFTHRDELENRIRFLLTTRPLDVYRNFEHSLWDSCDRVAVEAFNDTELREALSREGLQSNDLPNSLKNIAEIPRYFQTCIRLRELFDSFDNVTKEMVLWADLLYKIKHTDPQIRKKFDWQNVEEAQEDIVKLAREAKWANVDDAPQASVELLKDCFPNYHEIRQDLVEQRIALKAHKRQAELSEDHVVLGWAIHLSNLFDSTKFGDIENLFERFRQELEPIPSEDLRTKALFIALQISAISPDLDISQNQLSQKRAALMLAWFKGHNAQITDERLSFWTEKDPDAYAQIVEFEFEHHNSPNYEDALIAPLAKIWLNKKGDLNRLASRLKKWLLPTQSDSGLKEIVYIEREGHQSPVEKYDIQLRLLDAALSILSQRPERQFLKTLAHCYAILHNNANFDDNLSRRTRFFEKIGKLMRWGYTEAILGDLHWLAELAQSDELLLRGTYGLAEHLNKVHLPPLLQRPLSKKELEARDFAEQWNRRFKSYINRIRDQEKLLTGESPADNVKGNYHGLGYLAVRTDLPDLRNEDLVEIKKLLHHISANAKLGQGVGATLEDFCIKNLMPWIAKYDPESYAKLACSLKLNALNQEWARLPLSSIQGIMFKPEGREEITEAILGMRQRLVQGVQADNSSGETISLTSVLTETLLFSASEEQLTDWFEFLASHESLRESIVHKPLADLLKELLPKSIVKLARQKLEEFRSSVSDNQTLSNDAPHEFSEEDFWCTLYAYAAPINEETVKYALEDLKMREPDSTGTFPMLRLALSDSKQFLDEMLVDEKIKEHLSSKNGRQLRVLPYDKGKDVPSYDTLMSLLPPESVGSFLCSPDRRGDLARWGKETIEWICSTLQGIEVDFDYNSEMRFVVNPKILRTWAEQNTSDFSQLADEYLTELSKSPRYGQVLSHFTDTIRCLLLRFKPDKAMEYYRRWKTKSFKTVISTQYGTETFLDQLWRVEDCKLLEHRDFRRKLLEECLNDEEIMFMTLAALAGGGEEELWNLVIEEYLASPYAKERNLGVSILSWFGNDKAIEELEGLKSEDPSQWVREHAWWAYEVAQQERSCREVYREALQTHDLFQISAVFERIKPALSPTARWWREIEHEEFREKSQDIAPKLAALVDRFWYWWGNSSNTKRNIEVFGRKLREYCRGEKIPTGQAPRIAPWWKPSFN